MSEDVTQADRDIVVKEFIAGNRTLQDDISTGRYDSYWMVQAVARHRRASTAALEAELAKVRAENARLREALKSKPWPPSDADLREMLAHIVGAWWSNATAHAIRTKRALNPEDIRGMYAVRDALAPFIARASLQEPKP